MLALGVYSALALIVFTILAKAERYLYRRCRSILDEEARRDIHKGFIWMYVITGIICIAGVVVEIIRN